MNHDNIHFTLPNGSVFSIASMGRIYEVAVLNDNDFVPVSEWMDNPFYHNDVLPIAGTTSDLNRVMGRATAWAEKQKSSRLAEALDQAL